MRVCLSCVEFFCYGKIGGFGRATRTIAKGLVKRGLEVFAVVPRQSGQPPIEKIDGITVLSFPKYEPWKMWGLYKQVNADIYHASEPSLATWIGMKAMPDRKHIVVFQDARNFHDWMKELSLPAKSKLQVISNYIYEHHFLAQIAVRKADGVYTQSEEQTEKIKDVYKLQDDVLPLHNPVTVPASVEKAAVPTVGWMNRFDRIKRPELFLELAVKFPEVKFIAAGFSKDKEWDSYLRNKYGHLPNLEMPGFIDQFTDSKRHSEILQQSWIMVNSSLKEALPNNAYLESLANKCALLSNIPPDVTDFYATNFGYCGTQDDLSEGLRFLLENDRWRELGEKGYSHMLEQYRTELVIDQHLHVYDMAMKGLPPNVEGGQIKPPNQTHECEDGAFAINGELDRNRNPRCQPACK